MIANSLADLKPIPDLPDADALFREIESKGASLRALSVIAQFRALADAIQECRMRANAVDWEAWNRNYF